MAEAYKVRSAGLLPINGGPLRPWVPPVIEEPAPPASWQAAVDSRDWGQVRAWYQAYTGHEGLNPTDPTDLPVPLEDMTYVGSLDTTADGQVLEGFNCGRIRVLHNNVTIRRCYVRGEGTYAFEDGRTTSTGTTVEFCTFKPPGGPIDRAAIYCQNPVDGFRHTIRNCEINGFSSGVLNHGGGNIEYCWTTNFFIGSTAGAHISSLNARGMYVRHFRNFLTEGRSAPLGIYPDQRPVHHVEIRENLVNTEFGNNSAPEYYMQVKNSTYTPTCTDMYIGGNLFGRAFQNNSNPPRPNTGIGLIPWGVDNNVRESDFDFLDRYVV